jgi:hypothetical protein
MAYIAVKVHIYNITQRPSFSLYTGGGAVPLPMAWGGVQATPA